MYFNKTLFNRKQAEKLPQKSYARQNNDPHEKYNQRAEQTKLFPNKSN